MSLSYDDPRYSAGFHSDAADSGFPSGAAGSGAADSGAGAAPSQGGMTPIQSALSVHHERAAGRRRHRLHLGGGAALILTALICICLLCYGALTLVSAQADRRLTQRYEEFTAEYYAAYAAGQSFMAEADERLNVIYSEAIETADGAYAEEAYYAGAALLPSVVDPEDERGEWYDALQSILANTETADDEAGGAAGGADDVAGGAADTPATEAGDTGYTTVSQSAAPLLLFTQEISDTQIYFLLVRVQYPGDPVDPDGETTYYKILFSGTISTADYDYDSTLPVITK